MLTGAGCARAGFSFMCVVNNDFINGVVVGGIIMGVVAVIAAYAFYEGWVAAMHHKWDEEHKEKPDEN